MGKKWLRNGEGISKARPTAAISHSSFSQSPATCLVEAVRHVRREEEEGAEKGSGSRRKEHRQSGCGPSHLSGHFRRYPRDRNSCHGGRPPSLVILWAAVVTCGPVLRMRSPKGKTKTPCDLTTEEIRLRRIQTLSWRWDHYGQACVAPIVCLLSLFLAAAAIVSWMSEDPSD